MPIKRRKLAGISAIKLYFVHTATANPKPRKAAFFKVELCSDERLPKRKSRNTNKGIVAESVPMVAAWITRTGRNPRKKTRPK